MDQEIYEIERSFTTSFINNDLIDVSIEVSECEFVNIRYTGG